MSNNSGSLFTSLLTISLVPIMGLGIVLTVFSSHKFTAAMNSEVENGLKYVGVSVEETFDVLYPGDYSLVKKNDAIVILKGDKIINKEYDFIDKLKEQTGVDITLFYQDTRILTTIVDENSNRIIGTGAYTRVVDEVFDGNEEKFYDNALVNGTSYYAYYAPLVNSDGTVVGMISAAKPADAVHSMIRSSVMPIFIIAIIAMVVVGLISINYSKKLIQVIKKVQVFLTSVSKGKLDEKVDSVVLKREDEIGKMGRSALEMQKNLRILIEQDALTKLNNRRFGDNYLKEVQINAKKSEKPFSIAIGDIDFFKRVNDTYGHEAGDTVLKTVAGIMKQHMMGRGFAARWGGEEFLFVFENADIHDGTRILQEILDEICAAQVEYEGQIIKVTMTFGIVNGSIHTKLNTQLREADDKLYFGKQNGRNCVVFED